MYLWMCNVCGQKSISIERKCNCVGKEYLSEINIKPCSVCGVEDDLRPLGENGSLICRICAERDPSALNQRLDDLLKDYKIFRFPLDIERIFIP